MVSFDQRRRQIVTGVVTLLAASALAVIVVSANPSSLASCDSDKCGHKDITEIYGHHPFLPQKPETNVFADLPTKPHGKYKAIKPETNVFASLSTKPHAYHKFKPEKNVFDGFVGWQFGPKNGHKWHKGPHGRSDSWNVFDYKVKKYKWHKGFGRSNDYNVFDKKIKLYKWHKGFGRSNDYNVLDGFDYKDHDPEYDTTKCTKGCSKSAAKKAPTKK